MQGKVTMNKALGTESNDGGYYAIKGFLYQFDKTLIEVLTNRNVEVRFENQQDIDYEDFVLQVKHKETQSYAASKVRKAVATLLGIFSKDPTKRLCLYCHFKDRTPQDWHLTQADLDSLLSPGTKTLYRLAIREKFVSNFHIRFSDDYESQFKETLDLIKSSFTLPENEIAVLYHSIFRSKLLERSIGPRSARKVCFTDLQHFLEDTEVRVFETAYSKYIGAEKYARLIRKTYFTQSTPNLEHFERLFILDCDSAVNRGDLVTLAARISRRFYKKGKSPQPYLVFRNLTRGSFKHLKQELFDHGIYFFDGTHFDGDRFRISELADEPPNARAFSLKIVAEHQARRLVRTVEIKEVFQFFIGEPLQLRINGDHRRIQVNKTGQILQMIT